MVQPLIREARLRDIPALHPIFEHWVTDMDSGAVLTDEVAADAAYIADAINGQAAPHFLVAEEDKQVLGIMGIQPPTDTMRRYATTDDPAELTFALVADNARRKGIGSSLVEALSAIAIENGSTELVVASSQRYATSGWPFWEKLFGKPVGISPGYGGSGGDALVWRQTLEQPITLPSELYSLATPL